MTTKFLRSTFILVALLIALGLSSCGGSDEQSDGASSTSAASQTEAAFPATIAHKYGETTVTKAPKRVVVAGLREQDALLALGIAPVATTEWFGEHPGAIFPWAREALGSQPKPTVLGFASGLEIEKIAAQRPDLILAVYSGMTKKEYATLSKIAPTVAQPPGQVDYGSSWQDETRIVGQAIGKPKAAAQLQSETEAKLAAVRQANPAFKDQTAVVTSTYEGIYVYGPQDTRSRFVTDLGFTFPEELSDIGGKEFGGQLSAERVDMLDVGALIWFADPSPAAKIRQGPLYRKLDVSKQGRDLFIPEKGTVYEATSFISVLSIPLLIDELVPRIAAIADGDPATRPEPIAAT